MVAEMICYCIIVFLLLLLLLQGILSIPLNGKLGKRKKIIICVLLFIVLVAYVIGAIALGCHIHSKLKAEWNEKPECERNGHKFKQEEEYHNVLLSQTPLENVVIDQTYSGSIEGQFNGHGDKMIFIYHSMVEGSINGKITEEEVYKFYYQTADGGYKKATVPVEKATIYYTNGDPYMEKWIEYGNWSECEVCDETNYKWSAEYYKFYVPKGSIANEYSP